MSDSVDYFMAHARCAALEARRMRRGSTTRRRKRLAARVYHLLAKEASYGPNLDQLDDFRAARRLEKASNG